MIGRDIREMQGNTAAHSGDPRSDVPLSDLDTLGSRSPVKEMGRVSDHSGFGPFKDVPHIPIKAEEAVGEELVIEGFEEIEYTKDDDLIRGVGILCFKEEAGADPRYVMTTFSAVIADQVRRVPTGGFPLLASVAKQGKGRRVYYTLV